MSIGIIKNPTLAYARARWDELEYLARELSRVDNTLRSLKQEFI